MHLPMRLTSSVACFLVFLSTLSASVAVHAQTGNVTFWNRLDGGPGGSPSDIGPNLYNYNPSVDPVSNCCDVIGNVQFIPGKFGYAATLGPGNYYSTARVHALTLREVSSVLSPERGTIAVWYNEILPPTPYQHNLYRIFDGGFGFASPLQISRDSNILYVDVIFGGQDNQIGYVFQPNLNQWMHIAVAWDRNGIDGTTDTVRLYVEGAQVAALQSNTWGTGFGSNHADIAGGNDNENEDYAIDNLVIYDYAKTDFSDRFNESPLNGQTFSSFVPRGSIKVGPGSNDDSYEVSAKFTLAAGSNGINPLHEAVAIKFHNYTITIPAGKFQQQGPGVFTFAGILNNLPVKAEIDVPQSGGTGYGFDLQVTNANVDGTVIPPEVQLTIGDDSGGAKSNVGKACFGLGDDGAQWLSLGCDPY